MNFQDLTAYYEFIEQDNTILFNVHVSRSLINLRDSSSAESEMEICNDEIFYNDFKIKDGKLHAQLKYDNGNEYPKFELFKNGMAHLIQRAETVVNYKHKAKYNHILWESPEKHFNFAKTAIENYFLFLNEFPYPLHDNLSNRVFGQTFKNLYILSQTTGYKFKETIDYFSSLLEAEKISGFGKCSLIKFISENGTKIEKAVYQQFFDYVQKVIKGSIYPEFIKEYLEVQVSLAQKLGLSQKNYHNQLGEYYISLAEKANQPFAAHHFLREALIPFQKAGNKEKIETVTVEIDKGKKELEFKAHKFEYSSVKLQKLWDQLTSMIDDIIENGTSDEIYQFLATTFILFPKATVLEENIRPPMFDIITVTTYDINKNVNNKRSPGISSYQLHIQNLTLRLLQRGFLRGYKNGKISYDSLIQYLKEHTWLGHDFTFENSLNELDGFNWIKLISPSLQSFFQQSEIDIKSNTNSDGGYILSIDSLVLKFEGLFREFSRQIGAQTIEVKGGETAERISFEKLLQNGKMIQIIPEDDIAFYKFLFNPEWMNLRNNIAHCFYKPESYSAGIMFLLIVALLRLGNIKIPKVQ